MSVKQRETKYYDAAFKKAVSLLRTMNAEKKDGRITISFFGKDYEIDFENAVFHPDDISKMEKVLILHYLTSGAGGRASDTGIAANRTKGDYVSFDTLPNGMFYNYAFRKFGPAILIKSFGKEPEELLAAAQALNGSQESYGDVSVKLTVLPDIDVIVILYRGDDEFPPEANILFRDNIIDYLSLEDIAILGGLVAIQLKTIREERFGKRGTFTTG